MANTGTYGGLTGKAFIARYLAVHGPSRVSHIYAAMAAARGATVNSKGQYGPATYFFSREYCFISAAFASNTPDLSPPYYAFGTNRKPLWYRVSRGVYALNSAGMALASEVL